MISPRLAMLAVALAFGAALVGQRYWAEPPNPLIGTPEEVRPAEFWATQLPDLQNRAQALKQWQGKVLVVNFWAPWCPPCRKEIPDFMRLQERHGQTGLQFVGIALDEPDKVTTFVDETGINYPILLGAEEAAALSMASGNRLGGLPFTVVFDRRGNAVATLTGGVTEARLEALVKPLL
jgi:thiol-disulfide isomerase/thioredoxin